MSHFNRQLEPADHRPKTRRLSDLTNTELSLLFKHRSEKISSELEGHSFWESPHIVYWSRFDTLQESLFEVMMEIQSRYPKEEFFTALPVLEPKDLT